MSKIASVADIRKEARRGATRRLRMDDPRPWHAFFPIYLVLCLLQFVAAAGLVTLYVVLQRLYAAYSNQPDLVGWSITSYLLVSAVLGAICGRLGDLFGRRRMVCWMLIVAGIGAAVSEFSSSLLILVIGAAMQGAASALTPLAMGMAREYLPARLVPVSIGIVGAAASAGAGIAFIVVGLLVDHYGVNGGFLFKVVLSFATLIATLALLPRPREAPRSLARIDLLRGSLFVPGVTGIMIAVQKGATWGWTDRTTLGVLGASILLLVYWFRHQSRQQRPLIEVNLLFHDKLLASNLIFVLIGLGSVHVAAVVTLLLQHPKWTGAGFGLDATTAGSLFSPANFATIIIGPLAGWSTQRFGARNTALAGALLCMAVWSGFSLSYGKLPLVVILAILGVGAYAIIYTAITNVVVALAPRGSTAEATGAGHTAFMMGFAIGSQIIFGLLRVGAVAQQPGGPPAASQIGFTLIFAYVACTCVPMLALIWGLARHGARESYEAGELPAGTAG